MDNKGNIIKIDGVTIENIGDVSYQRGLFKEWIQRENKVVDFDRLVKLDDKVNAELDTQALEFNNKKWKFEWISINNFLCFGDDNYLPIEKYKGIVLVNSNPSNQGGKTTLIIDTFMFLLYGTTSRTDKNEDIFNAYRDKNELIVRGLLKIDGDEDIIIERKLTRSKKKAGGWTVVNKLSYYTIQPDGEELGMSEEDATRTTRKIQETVGKPKDFDLVSLATGKNLDDLVDFSVTDSGKMFTRFIGLEVMELKEAVVRDMYNKFSKTMKSNTYNIINLKDEIDIYKNNLTSAETLKKELETQLEDIKIKITQLDEEKNTLIQSKAKIDISISQMNPVRLENDIAQVTADGIKLKTKVTELTTTLNEIGKVDYDEYKEKLTTEKYNKVVTEIAINNAEIVRLNKDIANLKNSAICPTCHRELDGVDNTSHINEITSNINKLLENNKIKTSEEVGLKAELDATKLLKSELDRKNRLELEISKTEVKLGELRNTLVSKKNELKEYEQNKVSIEFNKNVEINLGQVKTNLGVHEHTKDNIIRKIENITNEITKLETQIINNGKLIEEIDKESEVEKIYKIYIDMVGKKGVSKLVLRSVLPVINSELERLLDDICDFDVEVDMDDKNDIRFLIVKDGIDKNLKTSSGLERTIACVALRCVLGIVSTLPMPNFVVFDEIFGKVAEDNIDKLKPIFDKIKDMYDKVFIITHNELIKDWSDKIITVNKVNNVSQISS